MSNSNSAAARSQPSPPPPPQPRIPPEVLLDHHLRAAVRIVRTQMADDDALIAFSNALFQFVENLRREREQRENGGAR